MSGKGALSRKMSESLLVCCWLICKQAIGVVCIGCTLHLLYIVCMLRFGVATMQHVMFTLVANKKYNHGVGSTP